MEEARYLEMLDPYLTAAFGSADWPTGFTPRLLLAVQLHNGAVSLLHEELGITDPRTKMPKMLEVIGQYAPDPENNVTSFATFESQG
jgi:hypothetical protein